tara:strand:+ start:548 stop:976 length:429 start_codon:yes stop_codon:yes gene_type:complete
MILYQLSCSNNHQFEAWFRDGATYDAQSSAGDITCPFCDDVNVSKAPMAPHLAKEGRGEDPAEARAKEVAEQILKAVDKLRKNVEENCDYVGDTFAEEARRIHYGETEAHDIYGEATDEETEELDEEGIEFRRLPTITRRND